MTHKPHDGLKVKVKLLNCLELRRVGVGPLYNVTQTERNNYSHLNPIDDEITGLHLKAVHFLYIACFGAMVLLNIGLMR